MLRLLVTAALVLTALFASANMALSREWETAGEMDGEWQLVYTYPLAAVGEAGNIMNLDGSDSGKLLFATHPISEPACSPSGSYLTFEANISLFTLDSSGGRDIQRWSAPTYQPSPYSGAMTVSDDGQTVIFQGTQRSGQRLHPGRWIVDMSSQRPLALTQPELANAMWFDLSPDGNQIVFQSSNGGIYLSNADGSNSTQLLTSGRSPDYSPDGTMLAFDANWDGAFNIYILDISRILRVQITHLPPVAHPGVGNLQPSWSPDGNQLVFIYFPEQGTSDTTVYMINIGSGEQRLVDPPVGIVSSACLLQTRPTPLTVNPLP